MKPIDRLVLIDLYVMVLNEALKHLCIKVVMWSKHTHSQSAGVQSACEQFLHVS